MITTFENLNPGKRFGAVLPLEGLRPLIKVVSGNGCYYAADLETGNLFELSGNHKVATYD